MEIKAVTNREKSDVSWCDSHASIAIVCVFLIAITWFVFAQTVRYDFVNYDDDTYVYANPLISSGLTVTGAIYAFSGKHSGNWHPLTTLSQYVGLPTVGLPRRWPSLYKYCPAHDRSRLVVSDIATNDRRAMAECIRCRGVTPRFTVGFSWIYVGSSRVMN
jgi:hypothetical protein